MDRNDPRVKKVADEVLTRMQVVRERFIAGEIGMPESMRLAKIIMDEYLVPGLIGIIVADAAKDVIEKMMKEDKNNVKKMQGGS